MQTNNVNITRFAPSPTGFMHVGNAFSALICQQWAEQHDARLLLRIEDIDFTRCRAEYTDAIIEDLRWLGINRHDDIRTQSEHLPDYQQALKHLRDMQLIYPCFCTRRQIQHEIDRMGIAPHAIDTDVRYPGTCKHLTSEQQHVRMQQESYAWRLDMDAAFALADKPLSWKDGEGVLHSMESTTHGDIVIGRKDIGISYHLAAVVDDAKQGITHVIRGKDLRPFADLHHLLQSLLHLPELVYIHHSMLHDEAGNRLAKRHAAITLQSLREMGIQPEKLREILLNLANKKREASPTFRLTLLK